MTSTYQTFLLGLLAGVLLAWGWTTIDVSTFFVKKPLPEVPKQSLVPKSGAIEVSNQRAGDSVRIDTVTVPPPGVWIAVRETIGEELGNTLGAVRVSGPQAEVSVSLLRDTLPGRIYAVELYRDDNEGAFDPNVNSVYVDFDTGARVIERFETEE